MKRKFGEVQLGKNGITDNFIETLKTHFKNRQNIKVSVLRNAFPDDEKNKKSVVKKYSEEIIERLGNKYTAKTVGFRISIRKWRRDIR